MNAEQKFLKGLYDSHIKVAEAIKKRFIACGGDVTTLDDPTGEIGETAQQKCEREHSGQAGVCTEDGTFIPAIG